MSFGSVELYTGKGTMVDVNECGSVSYRGDDGGSVYLQHSIPIDPPDAAGRHLCPRCRSRWVEALGLYSSCNHNPPNQPRVVFPGSITDPELSVVSGTEAVPLDLGGMCRFGIT